MTGDNELRRIREEAATWLARLRADDVSDADRAAFRAWADADARHRDMFDRATRLFESVGGVTEEQTEQRRRERRGRSRRVVLGGAVATVSGLGVAGLAWRQAGAKTYRTGHGETAVVRLKDGSTLTLDALSAARFDPFARRLRLEAGRASVEVGAAGKPFVIEADGWLARLEAGLCEVSLLDGGYSLLAVAGEARVAPLQAGGGEVRVRAGQRFTPQGVKLAPADHVLAWREGQLAFEHTRLADACRAFNRYGQEQLEVDARVADLPISGVYASDHGAAFAEGVARLHDLRLTRTPGGFRLEPAG